MYDGYYIYSSYRNVESNSIENGLKPYIYYTKEYTSGSKKVVINYTLDNYITVYYWDNSGNYYTKSGFFEANDVSKYQDEENQLKEFNEESKNGNQIVYKYTDSGKIGGRKKIYTQNNGNSWYEYSTNGGTKVDSRISDTNLIDDSATKYRNESKQFSNWIQTNLDFVKSENGTQVFTRNNLNNFNEERKTVLKTSIETNLKTAICSYNGGEGTTTYNFKMPNIDEEQWEKILNNVSMISFMEGLPMKNKYYIGYSVVTNTKNSEFVNQNSIYLIDSEGNYHRPNCEDVITGKVTIVSAYKNTDFERKTAKNENGTYYYPQNVTGCYSCIVASNEVKITLEEALNSMPQDVKAIYYRALAREKYNTYKSNSFK